MMIDLTYLKKRAEMTRDFNDEKVCAAFAKIIPPRISIADIEVPENNGFECVVSNKMFRNWIDLIPESDRGFVRFIYADGNDRNVEKYLKLAMTTPAFKTFQSFVSKDWKDSDLFLMRYLLWRGVVLKSPVGIDFGNYEMNMILSSLPIDISKDKVRFEDCSFVDFYRMFKCAEWGLNNVD
ncbi:MAG: hypothetical protein LBD94_00800 [Rickettsiales bacterium]|jgi:hypothetical protein|nr:hypothetical protein [Rickettsiales bacterium]